MARQVIWSDAALLDLEQITEYIALDSRPAAHAFAVKLTAAAASLREFPLRGRRVPELEGLDTRELILGPYRMLYEVDENEVSIVAIVHSRRDFRRVLGWLDE